MPRGAPVKFSKLVKFSRPDFELDLPQTWRLEEELKNEELRLFLVDTVDGRNSLRILKKPFPNLLVRTALERTEPWLKKSLVGQKIRPVHPGPNYTAINYEARRESLRLKIIGRLLVDGQNLYSIRFTLYENIPYFSKWVKEYEKLLTSFTLKGTVLTPAEGDYSLGAKLNLTLSAPAGDWFCWPSANEEILIVNYPSQTWLSISTLAALSRKKTGQLNKELLYQNGPIKILSIALDDTVNRRLIKKFLPTSTALKKRETLRQSMAGHLARVFPQMRWKSTTVNPFAISQYPASQFNFTFFDPLEMANVIYLIYVAPVKYDTLIIQAIIPEANYPATQPHLESLLKGIQIKPVE